MRTDTAHSRGYSPGMSSSCGPLRRPSGALPHSVVSLARARSVRLAPGFLFYFLLSAYTLPRVVDAALPPPDRLDPDLAAFLESLPETRDLSPRGISACISSPFTLQHSVVPHLETFRSVHVDPDTLCEVMPLHSTRAIGRADPVPPQVIATRPVQGISLSHFSEHGYRALEVLAPMLTPV